MKSIGNIIAASIIAVLVLALYNDIKNEYRLEQEAKGQAISNFIGYYHSYDVPPEDARFFDVTITTYDISIKDMEVFMTLQPDN